MGHCCALNCIHYGCLNLTIALEVTAANSHLIGVNFEIHISVVLNSLNKIDWYRHISILHIIGPVMRCIAYMYIRVCDLSCVLNLGYIQRK